ncbi:MAG: hypothetical protein EBU70_04995 [Actinobacteria bacterium]|nr:hypothetical protein [Actinomycetota bacterium]
MNLDLRSQSLVDGLSVEASAGTGKTYSITALVTRELVADPTLSIGEVLITTFTRNAAAQLRERMRRMLVAAEGALRGPAAPTDEFLASLRDLGDPADGAARIRRALATFDAANIMTIHQFCSIVLKAASQPVGAGGDDVPVSRLVAQAVNDELVGLMGSPAEPGSATAYLQDHLDPVGAAGVVTACLAHQRATPLLVTGASDASGAMRGKVERELRGFVEAAAGRVRATLRTEPSYDELVRRANEILGGGEHESVRAALAARFRFVLVDEAQDTDGAQWEILGAIFRRSRSLQAQDADDQLPERRGRRRRAQCAARRGAVRWRDGRPADRVRAGAGQGRGRARAGRAPRHPRVHRRLRRHRRTDRPHRPGGVARAAAVVGGRDHP